MNNNLPKNAICFVQNFRGEYRHRDYPYYVTEGRDEEDFLIDKIHDEKGEVIFKAWRMDTIDELRRLCEIPEKVEVAMISHLRRYGREVDAPFRVGPGHLTDGTVIMVEGLASLGDGPWTVKSVETNGPGSHIVICYETKMDAVFYGDEPKEVEVSFHIDFVKSIVSRPMDKGPARKLIPLPIDLEGVEKNGRWLHFNTLVSVIGGRASIGSSMSHRHADADKLYKRLAGMGLIKIIRHPQSPYAVRPPRKSHLVDFKRASAFLKKNPHWAFFSTNESARQDAEFWDEAHRDFDAIFSTEKSTIPE